jgi:hypothetical protein
LLSKGVRAKTPREISMNENNIMRSKGARLIKLRDAPANKGTRAIEPKKENQEKCRQGKEQE